jgi:hypothetical protein
VGNGGTLYYVKKHCFQHMDKKDWQAAWDFMLGVNQGSRHMKEKHKKAAAVGSASAAAAFVEELPEGPHIAKVMACFNEYFGSGSTEATENYSFLSEFCHPNSFAFTNHLEVEDPRAGTNSAKVTFIRPGRDGCTAQENW